MAENESENEADGIIKKTVTILELLNEGVVIEAGKEYVITVNPPENISQ